MITSRRASAIIISCALVLLLRPAAAAAEKSEVRLEAAGLERGARLIGLRVQRPAGTITLDDAELVEDDAPATGVPEGLDLRSREGDEEWIENLSRGVVIKKILRLDDPAAFSGRLLFKGIEVKNNTAPLHLSLNGVEFVRPPSAQAAPFAVQYTAYSPNDRWFVIDLPTGALRRGDNEVLMWTESETTAWRVLIALEKEFARGSLSRTHHPNRSLKSGDGGRTWSDAKLGPLGRVDGEYSVRLSLDRFVGRGEYISPVIDLVDGPGPLKRRAKVSRVSLAADIETPGKTAAEVLLRLGTSPDPEDPSWTDWAPAPDGGRDVADDRRYAQCRAVLSTADPLLSPKLRGFRLSAEWEGPSPGREAGPVVNVIRNGKVARASYPFGYEDLLHPELERYRKSTRLDRIVEGAGSEFEVMMRLLHWAYLIPVTSNRYSWNWNDVIRLEKGEKGMPRLQSGYKGRRRDAMCLYSNQALIGALLAFGFQARHVNIHSEAMSGHEVAEVWSNTFNKWFYLDATRDYYYFDPDTGVPLNALEIHDLVAPLVPRVETWRRPFVPESGKAVAAGVRVGIRQGENPFPAGPDARHILEMFGHFRIIPRNDFLSRPLPVPVHQGTTMWGWDGFLNYHDAKFPRRFEYQHYSDRAVDFYEPLNQAEVRLEETDERSVLTVGIVTFTPGFETFLVRLDGGPWQERPAAWKWALRPGLNRLEARVRNVRGVLGPVSEIEVAFHH